MNTDRLPAWEQELLSDLFDLMDKYADKGINATEVATALALFADSTTEVLAEQEPEFGEQGVDIENSEMFIEAMQDAADRAEIESLKADYERLLDEGGRRYKSGEITEEEFEVIYEAEMDAITEKIWEIGNRRFREFMDNPTPFEPGKERFEWFFVGYPDGEMGYDVFHVMPDGSVKWYERCIEHSGDLARSIVSYIDENDVDEDAYFRSLANPPEGWTDSE